MKIYDTVIDAIPVLQGCSHSCEWERWCAQYDAISDHKNLARLSGSGAFLTTVERLLNFGLPQPALQEVIERTQHYLLHCWQGRNSVEMSTFCRFIVSSSDDNFKHSMCPLIEVVCRRNMMAQHTIDELNKWLEYYQTQAQRSNILKSLPESTVVRNGRKI